MLAGASRVTCTSIIAHLFFYVGYRYVLHTRILHIIDITAGYDLYVDDVSVDNPSVHDLYVDDLSVDDLSAMRVQFT